MAKPDFEQPDADFPKRINLDSLLEQVGDLTQRAQNLVTNNESLRKPKPVNIDKIEANSLTEINSDQSKSQNKPNETKAKFSNLLDNLGKAKSDKKNNSKDSVNNESEEDLFNFENIDDLIEQPVDEPDMEVDHINDQNLDEPYKAHSDELDIDPKIQELAEDEINQIYTKISPKNVEDKVDDKVKEEKTQPDFDIDMIAMPKACKNIMMILFTINRPFVWIPNSFRNALGYFSLATLIFGLGLWGMLLLKY